MRKLARAQLVTTTLTVAPGKDVVLYAVTLPPRRREA